MGRLGRWVRRRLQSLLSRVYDAAQTSQYRKTVTDTRSADAVMAHAGNKLRTRARHLDENHDLAVGVLDALVNNIIGCGLTVEPDIRTRGGKAADKLNAKVRELWQEWQRRPEVTRELPSAEVQRLLCRAWLRDGEVLVQHILGRLPSLEHPTPVPYSLELIEADLLPLDYNDDAVGIVQGVQKNAWGRPVLYHLYKQHPGDSLAGYLSPGNDTKPVPAEIITHLKFTRRIRQTRGVSIFHAVLHRLDDVKDYEESERIAARVAAALTGYIKRSPDFAGTALAAAGDRTFEMSPGLIFDNLLPGEDVGLISSNRPNTGLNDFRNAMLRAVAAGTGAGYSTISKDYSGSYSSQRQELVETAPNYARLRALFIEAAWRSVYERFIQAATTSGALQVPANIDRATLAKCDIRGPGLAWIDPLKEVEADLKAIEGGLKSRAQVIRDRGGDPAVVDAQIEADTYIPKTQTAPPPAAAQPNRNEPADDAETDEDARATA